MKFLICLGLSVLMAVSCEADVCGAHANGCSLPYDLPYFYKNHFTPSCNRHDVCYACGHSRGLTRKDCDDKFYNRLTTVCDQISKRFIVSGSDLKKKFCDVIRSSYYEGVRVGGSSHWHTDTQSWCSESWVPSCI